MDHFKIKEGLGIDQSQKIKIKTSPTGYSIIVGQQSKGIPLRIKEQAILYWYNHPRSPNMTYPCKHCGSRLKFDDINFHHLVFRSAGGRDDHDNLLPLCFHCHVGDRAIHNGYWVAEKVVGVQHMNDLRSRYGIKERKETSSP